MPEPWRLVAGRCCGSGLATEVEVVVGESPDAAAAGIVIATLAAAVRRRGRARWVLAGGTTPNALYRRLAACHAAALDWGSVDFYWGDERCVPPDDSQSNFAGAAAALLRPLGVGAAAVHRIGGELEAEAAAAAYDATVCRALASGPWDLVLLGVGADGHTASLFPPWPPAGGMAQDAAGPWAVTATAPVAPRERVTLTLGALCRTRRVLFLATGAAKAGAVGRVLAGDLALPATHVRPAAGRVTWCLDCAAAEGAARSGG
jgi:6-phosphogluconolactonase